MSDNSRITPERDSFAYLIETSRIHDIFPDGRVPVLSITSQMANFLGMRETEVFLLDVERCSEPQLTELAERIAQIQGGSHG